MEQIKILHVIDRMDPKFGGVSQAVRTMIIGLDEMNTLSEVVSLDAPDAPFLQENHFFIHTIGPSTGPWSYSSRLIPWLVDNISRFDIVILHGMWLYNGYALNKAIKIIKKKQETTGRSPNLYVMPHGMLDPYFQRASGRKFKAIRNTLYWKLIENKIISQAEGLLFTCEEERRLAHEPFRPYRPKREMVVGLGVVEPPVKTSAMRDAFLKKCPGLQGYPYFLFLSRIHEKKGVDLLIKAYANLVENTLQTRNGLPKAEIPKIEPEIPRLVIAGPGLETSYGQELQQLVTKYQVLRHLIFFLDMVTGDVKWGAFYNCQAFVLPSHQENFGIAVVEALACGKPVLISNQINIWSEIEATGGGIIADDTAEGTTELLKRWMEMSDEDQWKMGQHARDCFNKFFAIGPAASNLLKAVNY